MTQKWNLRASALAIALSLATIAMVVGTRAPAPADAPYVTTPATSITSASQVLQLILAGQSSCTTSVTGTYTGALTRAYYDGQSWQAIAVMSSGQTGVFTDTPTSAQRFRVIMGAGPTGTAVVVITCSPAVSISVTASVPPLAVSPIPLPVTIPTDAAGNGKVGVANTSPIPVAVSNASAIPVSGPVTNTTPPTAAPVASAGAAATAAPPVIAEVACFVPAGAAPSVTGGNIIAAQCDANGNRKVVFPSSQPVAISNASSIPVAVSNASAIPVSQAAAPPTPPAATVVATSIPTTGIMTSAKGSAGVLVGATFTNSSGSVVYCGIYNTATAGGTTLGGTALVYVAVPVTGTTPVFVPPTLGVTFSTGITAGCATTYAGSTGVAANTVFASVFYY